MKGFVLILVASIICGFVLFSGSCSAPPPPVDTEFTFSCDEAGDVVFTGPDDIPYVVRCDLSGHVTFTGPDSIPSSDSVSYPVPNGNVVMIPQ